MYPQMMIFSQSGRRNLRLLAFRPVLVSFAAVVWARHAMLPPLGEGALRDELKQRLRRRLDRCWFMDFCKRIEYWYSRRIGSL